MPEVEDDLWHLLCIDCMGKGCEICEQTGFIEESEPLKNYINDKQIIDLYNDISFFRNDNILPNDGNRKKQTKMFIEGLRLYDAMKNAYLELRSKNGR